MIVALGLLATGLYMWKQQGAIVRFFALTALFCADLALLSLWGAL